MSSDEARNTLIVDEIVRAAEEGRHCLALTRRLEHLDLLRAAVAARTDIPVIALHGRMKPAERRTTRERIAILDASGDPFAVIAIDRVAGEGIDLPSLDTLFLATPVKFRGRIIQQIGRVTRGSEIVAPIVHDFRDSAVPRLENMYQYRRRVMAKEGFRVEK